MEVLQAGKALFDLKKKNMYLCVCVCVVCMFCVCMCTPCVFRCLRRPEGYRGAGVAGHCELVDMDAGNVMRFNNHFCVCVFPQSSILLPLFVSLSNLG